MTIFSQYGEPVHINLVRDKETGKSKGFAFLKYEDQRSTDLAVDNLGGATVMGRVLRVDHTRYKRKEEEGEEDNVAKLMGASTGGPGELDEDTDSERRRKSRRRDADQSDTEEERTRPMLKEEKELAELMRDHDDEDPMKEYLIQEKKEEVARALEAFKASEKKASSRRKDSRERSRRHRHHHHRRRRSEDRSRERSHRDRDDHSRRERHRHDRSESPHRRRDRSKERSRRERD